MSDTTASALVVARCACGCGHIVLVMMDEDGTELASIAMSEHHALRLCEGLVAALEDDAIGEMVGNA